MTTAPHHAPGTVEAAWLAEQVTDHTGTHQRIRVLDVRTPAEFETAHIPGSYNVPLELLKEHRDELAAAMEDQVVLVCRSGQRAEQAGAALAQAGMADVKVLAGGITAWEHLGTDTATDLVRGHRQWELERQVRLVAGSVVLASILTSIVLPQAKWVAGAIGAGLTLAAASNSCAMGALLSRLPYNRRGAADPQAVVQQLVARR